MTIPTNALFSVRKTNEIDTQATSKVVFSDGAVFRRHFCERIGAKAASTGEAVPSHPCQRNLVTGGLTNGDFYDRETFA